MSHAKKLFEALVREHADMLLVYLRSALGNVPDVDDLFQETMVIAWRRLDDFDETRPVGPWLRGIARKLLQSHYRKQLASRWREATLDRIEARLAQLGSLFWKQIDVLAKDRPDLAADLVRATLAMAPGRPSLIADDLGGRAA